MTSAFRNFQQLPERFGAAWNRFWFSPSDPIVLCALRVGTGLVSLYLLLTFSPDLRAFFAAGGLLPADAVAAWTSEHGTPGFWTVDSFSYLSYVSNPTTLTVLHVAAMAVLAAFTLGLFTRATSIASLVVVLSYMHRAPMLVSQVEPVVAMMLFYLCLAPCGACWSIDALWRSRRRRSAGFSLSTAPLAEARSGRTRGEVACAPVTPWATVATRLLQIHVAGFYLMIAVAQLAGGEASPWWEGSAAGMLIARADMPLVDTTWMAGRPFLVDFLTRFIVCVELGFPLLVWHRPLRPFVLAVTAVMWALLAIVSGLTTFCLAMALASLAFVPPQWVRALAAWATQAKAVVAPRIQIADSAGATMPAEEPSPAPQQKPRKSVKNSRQGARTR